MGLRPPGVNLFADERPLGYTGTRGRNLQRIVLDTLNETLQGVGQRAQQHGARRHNHDRADDRDDRRRQSLLFPHPACERLMQRVDRNRQDQRPDHQGQEGREDPIAQQDNGQNKAGADQDVEQSGRQLFVLGQGRIHCGLLLVLALFTLGSADPPVEFPVSASTATRVSPDHGLVCGPEFAVSDDRLPEPRSPSVGVPHARRRRCA